MPTAVGVIADSYNAPAGPTLPVTTGLAGWWDADDATTITASAGAVSQWNDKSGHGWYVNQPTGTRQPTTGTNTLNGRNVLTFDGATDYLQRQATDAQLVHPTTGEWSVFAVASGTGSGDRNILDQDDGGGARVAQFLRHSGTATQTIGFSTGGAPFIDTGPAITPGVAACWSAVATTTTIELFINGTSNGPTAVTAALKTGRHWTTIGAQMSIQLWQGNIAEVIAYARALSTAERQQVESYLYWKWMATPPPFPTSGLAGWWDADDASTFTYSSGTVVSQWRDKSGNNRHLAQGTVGLQPNRNGSRNGKPTVTFGNNPYLQFAGDTGLNVGDATVLAVFADVGTNADAGVVVLYAGANDYNQQNSAFLSTASAANYAETYRYSAQLTYVAGSGGTPWGVYAALFKSDGTAPLYRDGVLGNVQAPKTGTFTGATGGCLISARWLGSAVYSAARMNGDVGEIVTYSRVLDTVERQQVETYLKSKWGTP